MVFTAWFYGLMGLGTAIALGVALGIDLNGGLTLALLYDLGLGAIAAVDYWQTQPRRVQVTRSLEPRLSIGRPNPITLTVVNGAHPAQVQLQDQTPSQGGTTTGLPALVSLVPRQTHTLTYHFTPDRRGLLSWGAVQVRQRSPWGLVWQGWNVPPGEQTQVCPDLVGLRQLSIRLTLQSAGSIRQTQRQGMGTEFAELRDYGAGDDLRLVDWKATARRGRPLVRVLEPEQEQTLIILLDQGRLMTAQVEGLQRFDWGINAVLALALAGLHRGDRVGVGVFDRQLHTWIPPQRGTPHLTTLIHRLTPLEPGLLEPDYLGAVTTALKHQTRRALVVIITDLVDEIASSDLLGALMRLSPRYLPFCVTLRDPLLDRQAHPAPQAEAQSLDSAYGRAVALDLLAQRQGAFATLKQRGVLVLDAPAPHLSTALVDRYLRLKAHNRL